ncbi:MAG: 4Fe-4S binding protein [Actinomycetia bacterium]|nr:4Fe-4S binding protein [Actinomycetes bacterium]
MKFSLYRRIIQLITWLFVFILSFALFRLPTAVCWLCPFWYLQYLSATGNADLRLFLGVGWSPPQFTFLVIIGGFLLVTLIFGRVFCSWICPLGSLLEQVEKNSPFKIRKLPFNFLPFLKYLSLILFLALAFIYRNAIFCMFCPAGFIFRGFTGLFLTSSVIVFFLVIIFSLIYGWKAWCKVICPLGGFLGLLSKAQVYGIRVSGKKCKKCLDCEAVCPTEVKITEYTDKKELKNTECLMCLKCIEACKEHMLKFP